MSLEYGRSRTPWAARVWAEAAAIRCFIRRWKRPLMRAIGLMRFGGPEVLQPIDIPLPEPGPGEIRIRVNGLVDAVRGPAGTGPRGHRRRWRARRSARLGRTQRAEYCCSHHRCKLA